MAITVDDATLGTGNSSGGSGVPTNLSTAGVVAATARIIIIAGQFSSVGATMSVGTTGGLTWATDIAAVSGNLRVSIFSAAAPSGLANGTTLGIAHSNTHDAIIFAYSLLGVDTTTWAIGSNSTGAATAAWSSGNVTPGGGNYALVGGAFVDSGSVSSSTPAAGSERVDLNVPGQSETLTLVDQLTVSGTNTISGTWNAAATHLAAAVAYAELAGGAVVPVMPRAFVAIPFMK